MLCSLFPSPMFSTRIFISTPRSSSPRLIWWTRDTVSSLTLKNSEVTIKQPQTFEWHIRWGTEGLPGPGLQGFLWTRKQLGSWWRPVLSWWAGGSRCPAERGLVLVWFYKHINSILNPFSAFVIMLKTLCVQGSLNRLPKPNQQSKLALFIPNFLCLLFVLSLCLQTTRDHQC